MAFNKTDNIMYIKIKKAFIIAYNAWHKINTACIYKLDALSVTLASCQGTEGITPITQDFSAGTQIPTHRFRNVQ